MTLNTMNSHLLCICWAVSLTCFGQLAPRATERKLTDKHGRQITGILLAANETGVRVRRGSAEFVVQLATLSEEDQAFIRNLRFPPEITYTGILTYDRNKTEAESSKISALISKGSGTPTIAIVEYYQLKTAFGTFDLGTPSERGIEWKEFAKQYAGKQVDVSLENTVHEQRKLLKIEEHR